MHVQPVYFNHQKKMNERIEEDESHSDQRILEFVYRAYAVDDQGDLVRLVVKDRKPMRNYYPYVTPFGNIQAPPFLPTREFVLKRFTTFRNTKLFVV